jgi:rubrerythrin
MVKKTKSSIYNGVCLSKGKWGVSITIDGKKKYLGTYDNEIKAAMIYNKKAIEIYGKEYKKINDIDIDKELYEEYKQELNII